MILVCFTQPPRSLNHIYGFFHSRLLHCLNFFNSQIFPFKLPLPLNHFRVIFVCLIQTISNLFPLSFLFLSFLFPLSYSLLLFRFLSHLIILSINDPMIATSTSIMRIATTFIILLYWTISNCTYL